MLVCTLVQGGPKSRAGDQASGPDVLLTWRHLWSWGRGEEPIYSPVEGNTPAGGAGSADRASWLPAVGTGPGERTEGLSAVGQRASSQGAPTPLRFQISHLDLHPTALQTRPSRCQHQARHAEHTPHREPLFSRFTAFFWYIFEIRTSGI